MVGAADLRDEARNVATGRPVEVLSGIWELRDSLGPVFNTPNCWVSLWILTDPTRRARPVIVDSGVPRSTETIILPALRALGYQPRDLAVVVNTHSHHDHAGSNVQLREATGCQVWIHRDDVSAIEHGSNFGEEPVLPHSPDRILEHGDVLNLAGREYDVVHIPGHSPGSIGLYDRERKVFISGDAIQAQGTSTQGIAGAQDREGYYRSLARVEALEIEHLLAAHPYAPFPDSHVFPRTEVRRYVAESRRFFDEIDGEILAAIRAEGGEATAEQVAEHLCRARGYSAVCELTVPILRGYLHRLSAAGRITAAGNLATDHVVTHLADA